MPLIDIDRKKGGEKKGSGMQQRSLARIEPGTLRVSLCLTEENCYTNILDIMNDDFFFFISGAASNNLCYLLKSDKQPTLRSLLSQVSGRTGTKYSSISIVGYTFDLNFLRLTSAHSSERNTPVHIKGKIK